MHDVIRVLFLCTHNSARSIIAEALLAQRGGGCFQAESAGVAPAGIHPLTLVALQDAGIPTDGLRSKRIEEVKRLEFDYVITLCDEADQACPTFASRHAERLHWGIDDPSSARHRPATHLEAFAHALAEIDRRLRAFIPLAVRAKTRAHARRRSTGAGSERRTRVA